MDSPNFQIHELASRPPETGETEYAILRDSIAASGLQKPITVMVLDGIHWVIDGRTRLKACQELGIEPAFKVFEGNYDDAVDLVIVEMIRRNLNHAQTCVTAEAFMDDLSLDRKVGRPTENERKNALVSGKSSEIAAKRFGVSPRSIEQVREIRFESPLLYTELRTGKAKVAQAVNRLKIERARNELNKSQAAGPTSNEARPQIIFKAPVIVGDCVEEMESFADESIDQINIDPPFNIGWSYHGDPSGDRVSAVEFAAQWHDRFTQSFRVLKASGSMWIWTPPMMAMELYRIAVGCGFEFRDQIALPESFGTYHGDHHLGECWRSGLYFTKSEEGFIWNPHAVRVPSLRQTEYGDKRANPAGRLISNVWPMTRVQGTSNDRVPFEDAPPQMPLEPLETAVLLTTNEGDTVLDYFLGNGTAGIAALKNGRKFIGIERSPLYAKQAQQWIASQLSKLEQEAA